MKAKYLIICFLSLLIIPLAYAQELPGYKAAFEKNRAADGWFVSLGAGGQVLLGDNDNDNTIADRARFMPAVSIGKWFSPYLGIRLKGQGGTVSNFENNANYKLDMDYYNVHLDGMWDVTNYLGKYNPKRIFTLTPYVGIGFAHRFALDESTFIPEGTTMSADCHKAVNALSVQGGLQFGFRLSNRVNLDFDLGATVLPDAFDGTNKDTPHDAILTATGGITIKIGKTDYAIIDPMDYGMVEGLNNKINMLWNENEKLKQRPESCPEPDCPEVAPIVINEVNYVANVVFFRINSATVDNNQQGSIFTTAQFMKESGEKIRVVGYADKATGSEQYNLKLSEKRAKAVAHELVNTYQIPTQHIVVEWKGSDEQPYKENNWNRVVIMSVQ